jgi:hypothetical protein
MLNQCVGAAVIKDTNIEFVSGLLVKNLSGHQTIYILEMMFAGAAC